MSSETTLAAAQFRLQEWAAQIRDCQNRPDGMSVVDWCACNGLTKANYYYRLRRVRKACLEKIAQDPVSLETPIGEEDDSHLGDFIQDEDSPAPQDSAAHTLLREQLEEVMDTLTPREAMVLKLRFGLEDGKARTLEEVGKQFDVTRERIRQIEAKALRKLRHPSRSKKLRDYMG